MLSWEHDLREFLGEAGGTKIVLFHLPSGSQIEGGVFWPNTRGGHRGYIDIALHLPTGFPRIVVSLYTKHSVRWCTGANRYVRYGNLILSDKDHNMILNSLLTPWSRPESPYTNYENGWEARRTPQEDERCHEGCACEKT